VLWIKPIKRAPGYASCRIEGIRPGFLDGLLDSEPVADCEYNTLPDMQFENLALIVLIHKSYRGLGFYEIFTPTRAERASTETMDNVNKMRIPPPLQGCSLCIRLKPGFH